VVDGDGTRQMDRRAARPARATAPPARPRGISVSLPVATSLTRLDSRNPWAAPFVNFGSANT
jgi:hypothetical protein